MADDRGIGMAINGAFGLMPETVETDDGPEYERPAVPAIHDPAATVTQDALDDAAYRMQALVHDVLPTEEYRAAWDLIAEYLEDHPVRPVNDLADVPLSPDEVDDIRRHLPSMTLDTAGLYVSRLLATLDLADKMNAAVAEVVKEPTYCTVCPHAMYLHNDDGSCPCGMRCSAKAAR